MFASGGGSRGWTGGEVTGIEFAKTGKTFVALTGDGSYVFSATSADRSPQR